jgi:hypothetical protein
MGASASLLVTGSEHEKTPDRLKWRNEGGASTTECFSGVDAPDKYEDVVDQHGWTLAVERPGRQIPGTACPDGGSA